MEAYGLSTTTKTDNDDRELEILLEAARRATWDALHGPRHLRSGRFFAYPEKVSEGPGVHPGATTEGQEADQPGDSRDGAARRT